MIPFETIVLYQQSYEENQITMTTIHRCENACVNKDNCFNVDRLFACNHYQCSRTTVLLNYCIACGNNQRIKQRPQRCRWCQVLLTPKEIEYDRTLCMANNCFLEHHLQYKFKLQN